MNDDEFFSQFPASPPPEFADSLRAKLALIDQEGVTTTMAITSEPPSIQIVPKSKQTVRDRYATLVATMILVLFVGASLVITASKVPSPLPLAQPNAKPISKENAKSLHHIGQVGSGRVYEAVWSPDGTLLFMPGTAGIWVFDATDLTKPIDNLYPELTIYAGLVFSDNGQRMAFTSDGGIRIWEVADQRDITPDLSSITASPAAIDLSPDGHVLAVGDFEGGISFYNTETGATLSTHPSPNRRIFDLKFSPDGTEVAFIGQGTPVLTLKDETRAWKSEGIKTIFFSPVELSGLQAIRYNNDGTHLAARTATTVYIWDTATGEEISRLEATNSDETLGITNGVTNGFDGDLMFSPDGTQLVTDGSQIRLWDIEERTSQTLYNNWNLNDGVGGIAWDGQGPDFYPVEGRVHFNPDWTQISRMNEGVVVINDAVTTEPITYHLGFQTKRVYDVAFSPDGEQLMTWSEPRALLLWNVSDLSSIPFPRYLQEDISTMGDNYGYQHAVFSPDSPFVAGYVDNGDIVMWNQDGTEAQHWPAPEYEKGPLQFGGFIAISADGTRLVSKAPYASLVWIWDAETGQVIRTIEDSSDPAVFGTMSSDGRFVAVARHSQTIVIYDTATGEGVRTLNGHKAQIHNLVYSPDGRSLLSAAADGTVYLWNLETGAIAHSLLDMNGSKALAFSPDGQLVAGAQNSDLLLWDVATGEVTAQLPENAPILTLAFSADGHRLAAGLENGTVQIWGLE